MTLHFQPPAPDHVPGELMVDFDFFAIPPGCTDPAEIWHDLVRRGVPPIFYTPRNGGHWVFLDYADIVAAYRDYDIFSNHQIQVPNIEPFPVMQPNGVDPPQHKVFRNLLAPLFTPAAVRGMTGELHARAQALVDRFADRGRCDFIGAFAERYPTGTFLYLFGLPEERLEEFLSLANVFFRSTDPEARARNLTEIYAVLEALFRERERTPGDDIASVIVTARDNEGKQHPWIDILNCGFLLFVAGLDTVTNTMAYVWRYLATTRAARRYFVERLDDPDAFLIGIEELMRINAVSNIFRRVTHDCEFRGIRLRHNDRVVLPNTVANRAPASSPIPRRSTSTARSTSTSPSGSGPTAASARTSPSARSWRRCRNGCGAFPISSSIRPPRRERRSAARSWASPGSTCAGRRRADRQASARASHPARAGEMAAMRPRWSGVLHKCVAK